MKKIFGILILFYLAAVSGDVNSQSITWEKLYNSIYDFDDDVKDLCFSEGENFFAVGNAYQTGANNQNVYVLKLNPNGDTIWTKVYGNHSGERALACVSSGDGGCVIAGERDSCFLIKINSNGNTIWKKYYRGDNIILNDIVKTSDGGYIACGRINGMIRDGYILKVDSVGNLQWKKIISGNFNKSLNSVIQDKDKYILSGYQSNSKLSGPEGLIVKLNLSGDIIWSKTFKINPNSTIFEKLVKFKTGYLLSGNTVDSLVTRGQFFLSKSDTAGNVYFSKILHNDNWELVQDFIFSSNRIILTCDLDSNFRYIAKVYILDTDFNVINSKNFFTSDHSRLRAILPVPNGDLIFGGYSDTYTSNDQDIYLVRTDSNLKFKPVSVISNDLSYSMSYKLYQNYPNPFNSATNIKFEINYKANVKIKIYNLNGKLINTLVNATLSSGIYVVNYNAHDFSSGIYSYVLYLNDLKYETKLMVLLK